MKDSNGVRVSSTTFGIPNLAEVGVNANGEVSGRLVSAQGIVGLSEDVAIYGDNNGQLQSIPLLSGEAQVLAAKHFGSK